MVNDVQLVPLIEELELAAQSCTAQSREKLQIRLHHVIDELKADGVHVPQKLFDLEDVLIESCVEDQFDNLPV